MASFELLRLTAFADDPEGGNPAGVVLDAGEATDDEMQTLAAQVGYSETAFLFPDQDDDQAFTVRYFSPQAEVDFCGHATIAAGVALGSLHGDGLYEFSTNAGVIPVDVSVMPHGIVATLTSPEASSEPMDEDDLDALLETLDWEHDDLDPRFVPAVAFAGNYHPVLVTNSRRRLGALDYEWDDLLELMQEKDWLTIQLVYPKDGDPHQRVWFSRNPAPVCGVYEDPATGSSAAALGAFFRDYGIYGTGDHVTLLQGDDMGRPSSILLSLAGGVMKVSGTAIPI